MKILLKLSLFIVFSIFFSTNFLLTAMEPSQVAGEPGAQVSEGGEKGDKDSKKLSQLDCDGEDGDAKDEQEELIEPAESVDELGEELKKLDVDREQATIATIMRFAIKNGPKTIGKEKLTTLEKCLTEREKLDLSSVPGLNQNALGLLCKKELPNLRELNLAGCWKLKSITSLIRKCPNLIVLTLTNCTGLTDQTFTDITRYCKKLTTINFSNCYQLKTYDNIRPFMDMGFLKYITISTTPLVTALTGQQRSYIRDKGITLIESSEGSSGFLVGCCIS